MGTVSLDILLPDTLVHLPGCSDDMARSALRASAVDMCARTLCWVEDQDEETVAATDWPYQVTPPAHGTVLQILNVTFDGVSAHPTMLSQMRSLTDWQLTTGSPTAYMLTASDTVRAYPLPSGDIAFRATVAYAPRATANVIEDFLYTVHAETLVHGALRRLMAVPGKPWSAPEGVAYHTGKYEQGVHAAHVNQKRGLSVGSLSVSMRPMA
jgi:hypothetical protein